MVSAYNVGERIRTAIAEEAITTDSDPPQVLHVTASFGIASYPETRAATGEDLVRKADRALYRAKKTGKNRVELFWSDDSQPVRIPTDEMPRISPIDSNLPPSARADKAGASDPRIPKQLPQSKAES